MLFAGLSARNYNSGAVVFFDFGQNRLRRQAHICLRGVFCIAPRAAHCTARQAHKNGGAAGIGAFALYGVENFVNVKAL